MFAIVEVGGKQYRVEEGGRSWSTVSTPPKARPSSCALCSSPTASDVRLAGEGKEAKVTARVVEHFRGPKIIISRFKPKRGWRKKTGFRSGLTRLEVKKIA